MFLILEGADLIDGSGGPVIGDSLVVVDRDRILYAGRRTSQYDAVRAIRWHLAGKVIVPGLIEAHTHAASDADMRAYVKNGITTIRFAGLDQATIEDLRRRIDGRELRGPRILSCGPMIDQPPPAYPEWSISVGSPAQAAAAAGRLIAEYDVDALIVTQRVAAPVMRAVIEVAHAHGRSVVGQTWEVDGKEAARLGIDELHTSSRVYESRTYPKDQLLRYGSIADRLALASRAWASIDWDLTQPIIEAMVEHGVRYCGMQVITQYQVGEGIAELEADSDFAAFFGETEKQSFRRFTHRLQGSWTQDDLEHGRVANDNRMEWMRRFRALGGILLAGTDMQFGGIMLHRELRNLAATGMSPMQVIAAATGGCARALNIDARLGLLREGRMADLIVLNRSPLEDLGALRDILCVIKGGTVAWEDERALRSLPARPARDSVAAWR